MIDTISIKPLPSSSGFSAMYVDISCPLTSTVVSSSGCAVASGMAKYRLFKKTELNIRSLNANEKNMLIMINDKSFSAYTIAPKVIITRSIP